MLTASDRARVHSIHLVFHRAGRGKFLATYEDRELCVSDQPLVCAANLLIDLGYDPETPVLSRLAGGYFDNLTTTLAIAASGQFEEPNVLSMHRRARS